MLKVIEKGNVKDEAIYFHLGMMALDLKDFINAEKMLRSAIKVYSVIYLCFCKYSQDAIWPRLLGIFCSTKQISRVPCSTLRWCCQTKEDFLKPLTFSTSSWRYVFFSLVTLIYIYLYIPRGHYTFALHTFYIEFYIPEYWLSPGTWLRR